MRGAEYVAGPGHENCMLNLSRKLKRKKPLRKTSMYWRLTLKIAPKMQNKTTWVGFIWFRTGSCAGLL